MKSLLIAVFCVFSFSTFALEQADANPRFEILNRKTQEKITGQCSDASCSTLSVLYSVKGESQGYPFATLDLKNLSDQLIANANAVRKKPEYFSVNKQIWHGNLGDAIAVTVCTLGYVELLVTAEDLVTVPIIAIIRAVSSHQFKVAREKLELAIQTQQPIEVSNGRFKRILKVLSPRY